MGTIQETWSFMVENVLPHWPGIMFIVIVIVIAQTLKMRVLTVKLAKRSRFIFWMRRVFPLTILALGVVTGVIWPGEASPGVTEMIPKIFYFAGCSGMSIIGFNVFKQWIKRKYDVDLEIARDSAISAREITKRMSK